MTAATPDSTPGEVVKPKETSGGPGAFFLLGGGLAIMLGSFLPWMSLTAIFVGTITKTGMDGGGDGSILLVAGVILAAFGVVRLMTRVNSWVQVLVPLLIGGFALIGAWVNLSVVNDRLVQIKPTPMVSANVGPGLYLILLGAAVTLVAAGITLKDTYWKD